MIGAGNIGRGFIGAMLEKSGCHVTFADVNAEVIGEINRLGKYTVHIRDAKCDTMVIEHISGISSATEELEQEVARCQIVTTAVGLRILPVVAGPIARGIRLRREAGNTEALNIVACENAVRASSRLKEAVYALLSGEDAAFADTYIGFPDCAVDRIVPKADLECRIDVAVERFAEWDIERSGWVGEIPVINGASFVEDLDAYNQRKLFTLNSGHAICAYLGCLRGHKTIMDSIQDPVIDQIVLKAMEESGAGLIRKFGFDPEKHQAYINCIFDRFHNPYLQDEVDRVGREPIRKLGANDRLIKPMVTAFEYGLPTDYLIFGTAAALRYHNSEDPQSVELQQTIAERGVGAALEQYTGLGAESVLFTRILDVYRALAV